METETNRLLSFAVSLSFLNETNSVLAMFLFSEAGKGDG